MNSFFQIYLNSCEFNLKEHPFTKKAGEIVELASKLLKEKDVQLRELERNIGMAAAGGYCRR